MKLHKVSFVLTISDKEHILPLMPRRVEAETELELDGTGMSRERREGAAD